MWHEGTIGIPLKDSKYIAVHYWVKVHTARSPYGIDGGRIIKLSLKQDGEYVANYDRGWDIHPTTKAAEAAYRVLLFRYN